MMLSLTSCQQPVNLDKLPNEPRYQADIQSGLHNSRGDTPPGGQYLQGDFNGDGTRDVVIQVDMGLLCFSNDNSGAHAKVIWQHNLPPSYRQPDAWLKFGAAADLDGDGADEALLTVRTSLTDPWLLYIHDSVGGECDAIIPLPMGPDRNGDGHWDGTWDAMGLLPGIRDDGGPGLVMLCQAGYDYHGRGVAVIDPRNGEVIWRHEIASNPIPWTCRIDDLDGDGDLEIAVSGSSPSNRGSDTVNGWSDNRAGVVVLDQRGERIWSRQLGAFFYGTHLVVGDLDADGHKELVIATNHHSAGDFADTLAVFNAVNGDLLACKSSPSSYQGLFLDTPDTDGRRRIYTGSLGGAVERHGFAGDRLSTERVARSTGGAAVATLGNLLPEPGEELLVVVKGERDLILDLDLKILTTVPSQLLDPRGHFRAEVWEQADGRTYLLRDFGTNRDAYHFIRREQFPWWQVLTGIGLALAALLAVVGWRKTRRPLADAPQADPFDQDILIRLLQGLEISSHGRFSILRSLRILEERMGYSSENQMMRNRFEEQIGHSYADFIDTGYPSLVGILEMAKQIGFQPDLTGDTEQALCSLKECLGMMAQDRFSFRTIVDNLDLVTADNRRVESGFRKLRRSVEERVSADPVEVIERLLGLVTDNSGLDDMVVSFVNEMPIPAALCLIDHGDLRFVIENLLDNAVKAMQGSSSRELTVKIVPARGKIMITISDTGAGIDPVDVQQIFDRDFTSKSEGGLGLWQSRRLLDRWGGQLSLTWSEPGSGSCFTLLLPGITGAGSILSAVPDAGAIGGR